MSNRVLPRLLGPASRVALGLIAMVASLMMLVDLAVPGFLPNPAETLRRERQVSVQWLGHLVAQRLSARDAVLDDLLLQAARQDPTIASAAVVAAGEAVASLPDHTRHWTLAPAQASTVNHMRVPLRMGATRWGELQVAFQPAAGSSLRTMLDSPLARGLLLVLVLGFVSFALYLRRAMVYLDPAGAVPDRVRLALDTLSEAVLVIDRNRRVLLANRVLRSWSQGGTDPVGLSVDSIAWLAEAASRADGGAPWATVLSDGIARQGDRLQATIGGAPRHFIVNCSPIAEGRDAVRGCLLTLTDVTALEEHTLRLRQAMDELAASREEIRRKNAELTVLATRDPLTGCLNRRAFESESAAALTVAAERSQPVSCVMCDIDHFKKVNDTYGHAGGDLVLQAAAKLLESELRTGDLLARFGGEEFCILLPNASAETALSIAERLRARVAADLGRSLRQGDDIRVTMSFGVEAFGSHGSALDTVIDLADQALYHSKKSGRNRVTAYAELAAPVHAPA